MAGVKAGSPADWTSLLHLPEGPLPWIPLFRLLAVTSEPARDRRVRHLPFLCLHHFRPGGRVSPSVGRDDRTHAHWEHPDQNRNQNCSLHSLNACFPKAPAMMLLVLPHVPAPYMCMRPFCQSRAEQSQDLPCAQENRLGFSPPCVTVCGVRLGEGLQVRKGLGKASAAQQGLDIAGSVPGAGMRWAVMSCGFYVVNIEHRELR